MNKNDLTDEFVNYILDKISMKVIKENATDRARIFTIVLYDDTSTYNTKEVLDYFMSLKRCAFIKHTQDLKEDLNGVVLDELKKPHYHIVVKYDNATTISAISKKSGVPTNYIQPVRSERQMLRYLTHIDDKKKYQYNISDIVYTNSYQREIKSAFDDIKTEEEQMLIIQDFIKNLDSSLPYATRLFKLILSHNVYKSYYNY